MCLAIPGQVAEVFEREGLRFAKVRFGGVVREVCLVYEPEAAVGEYVLVHVGFAIARIDAERAARTWDALRSLAPEELDGDEPRREDPPRRERERPR